MFKLWVLLSLVLKCYSYHTWSLDYDRYKTPQEVMVDVVNNLALKLLAIHNENNDNNIAISPYGVLSVLIALKEGVRGNAVLEIDQAANIPSDLAIIRVGLRDIHRHLKSYFIPEEGFLSGLTLSHDNVTLNPNYEEILRFYGFDINSFNNGLYPEISTTTESMETTTEELTEKTTEIVTTEKMMETQTESTQTSEKSTETASSTIESQTTESTKTEKTTEVTTTEKMLTTEIIKTSEKNTETATDSMKPAETTTEVQTTEMEIQTIGNTETEKVTAAQVYTTEIMMVSGKNTESVTSAMREQTTENTESATETTPAAEESLAMETQTTESATTKVSSTGTEISTSELSTLPETSTEMSTTESLEEKLIDGTTELNNNTERRITRSVVDYIIARYYDDRVITQRPPPYNPSDNDLYFLINGRYKESNINYMTYDTVLPYHYIPHLQASALRFPLDSSRYYLLLLLPEDPTQINKLICDLKLNGNLKYIIDNLRFTHVKAVIPSFMLKGFVVLTSTFQKMGIYRVFEPRQADFSPMTADQNIYVTNIEQAITVNIRNYVDPTTMTNDQYLQKTNPVLFKADHPFLYFVIDSEINVTLMVGKIINPLNSRIR